MFHDILFLILGLLLLVFGADYVTDGAVAVARRFNVSNLMIGLTVVALGSTLPDIVVCVEAAFQNKPEIAVGEVIGSNIFDLLLVIGIMALIRPFKASGIMLTQDLPILLIASAALWITGDTVLFDNAHHNVVDRSSGMMMIIIFIFYMWFMIYSSKHKQSLSDPDNVDSSNLTQRTPKATSIKPLGNNSHEPSENMGIVVSHSLKNEIRLFKTKISALENEHWFSWLMIVAGLAALVIGGNWVVDGASGLALKIGMSQAMVALTVVAIGNALPDLVTSVTATVKGASGIALGNIVGSCILNALLSIGISSIVIPLKADTIGFVDFFTLVGASAILWLFPLCIKSHKLGRSFGLLMTLLYVAYMLFTILRG